MEKPRINKDLKISIFITLGIFAICCISAVIFSIVMNILSKNYIEKNNLIIFSKQAS